MNKTNMLSAQKVKLHGMTSTKWTTRDKITQYKGLINLYTRDKNIVEIDNMVARKKQAKEMKQLQGMIDKSRIKLENAIAGDKQKLRNSLADHRKLQNAFQNSNRQKVIDVVNHLNFNKRKFKDKLRYRMKLKSDTLIDLKLKCSLMEDNLKYSKFSSMLPCEKEARTITAKVQDAILKKEAAIYVRNSYKEMIAIMKKDAIYFDAIIISLKNDGLSQGNCMITATKLGQIGTEYLDDRRQDFEFLEKIVKFDMVKRKGDLTRIRTKVESYVTNLMKLVRRDSDINLGKIVIPENPQESILENEINTIVKTLKILQTAFFASSLEQLYPFIREQVKQKERLTDLRDKLENQRNDMYKKKQCSTFKQGNLKSERVDTTVAYNEAKVILKSNKQKEDDKQMVYQTLIENRYQLLSKVRYSLKHFQYLSALLSKGEVDLPFMLFTRTPSIPAMAPVEEEIDGVKIIPELINAFEKLSSKSAAPSTAEDFQLRYKLFESLMRDRSKRVEEFDSVSEESLIETVFVDTRVPTHDDIKKQSEVIVAWNLAELEYKPPPELTKKKKK